MYFSKNSRYVLRKAQFITPTFFKSAEKNLSVKIPKDDPTKPPLRYNIPEDKAVQDEYTKHIQIVKESGTISNEKEPTTSFQDDLLLKSENEIELFPQFERLLGEENLKTSSKSTSKLDAESLTPEKNNDLDSKEADSKNDFQTPSSKNTKSLDSKEKSSPEAKSQPESSASGKKSADEKSKFLYIIIDMPENGGAAKSSLSESVKIEPKIEVGREETKVEPKRFNLFSSPSPIGLANLSSKNSRSLPKISFSQSKHKLTKRFEIQEIEDPVTYVFHLRLDKSARKKSEKIGIVPEKEVSTRNDVIADDGNIKTLQTTQTGNSNFFDGSKKPKCRRSDTSTAISVPSAASIVPEPATADDSSKTTSQVQSQESESVQQPPKPLKNKSNVFKEERKSPPKFERDDFGRVRTLSKQYPFKMPIKRTEFKEDSSDAKENYNEVGESSYQGDIKYHQAVENYYETFQNHYQTNENYQAEGSPQGGAAYDKFSVKSYEEFTKNHWPEQKTPAKEETENNEEKYLSLTSLKKRIESSAEKARKEQKERAAQAAQNAQRTETEKTKQTSKTSPETDLNNESINTNQENSSAYISIHELKQEKESDKKKENQNSDKHIKTSGKDQSEANTESGITNFKTSTSSVWIGCEKVTSDYLKFSAAFPPLLGEALKTRFKFKKTFPFFERAKESDKSTKNNAIEFSENSILFPKKDGEKFDCESLLSTREDIIFTIIKNSEVEKASKTSNKVTASEDFTKKGDDSLDSLSVMKKVKEIVQFDLDNVVKIFNDKEQANDPSSVVIFEENKWRIDTEELTKQTKKRSALYGMENMDLQNTILEKREVSHTPKMLPSRESAVEMKLNSVIMFNPKTNEFFINKEALAEAISQKTNEPFEEVIQTLNILAKDKRNWTGDSILVFDDETQSWKVDFSILEKREQQIQLEEELTKRSELILETFEKLEKGQQIPTISMPNTSEKKTFDYKKEQWNAYDSGKSSTDKSTKQKSPFKEPDAEEIRKKNSDLYENLFVSKKKDATMNQKKHSSTDSTTQKPSDSNSVSEKAPEKDSTSKKAASNGKVLKLESSTTQIPPQGPIQEPPKGQTQIPQSKSNPSEAFFPESKNPPKEEKKQENKDEKQIEIDDDYWGSFLKMNILPRDIKEIPKKSPLEHDYKKQPFSLPPDKRSKIEKPKQGPLKKIEEPKFKIHIPFIKDKKIQVPKFKKTEVPPPNDKKAPKTTVDVGKEKNPGTKPPEVKVPPKDIKTGKETPGPTKPTPTIPDVGSSTSQNPPAKTEPPSTTTSKKNAQSTESSKKAAPAIDHYVSDKIIEISRNKTPESSSKVKTNKVETVKLNLNSDKRLPSKVTEINLNKKLDDKLKEPKPTPQNPDAEKSSGNVASKTEPPSAEKSTLHKNLEKYKTPFSEPDFEEKPMKIKSDLESNPNLKKLDNWSKTLVLHDIMKPPENIETWLKDETDKMATLLLKVLQEAADGKPKKKPVSKSKSEKQLGKVNPYDNIRKKQETTPEKFLFRVRTVNLTLENDRKTKPKEVKLTLKPEKPNNIGDSKKTSKSTKGSGSEKEILVSKIIKNPQKPQGLETKFKSNDMVLEAAVNSALMSKDFFSGQKLPLEITEEIPGPEILKKISNAWKVFPVLGCQMTVFTLLRLFQLVNLGKSLVGSQNLDKTRRHAFSKLFMKYGPIVNVQGPLSGNVILIHTPEHLNAVFEQDSSMYVRSIFDSVELIRHETEENSFPAGNPTDWTRPEWNDLKKGTLDPMLKNGEKYFGAVDVAAEFLISNIKKYRNSQNFVSEDFMSEIKRWSMEGLCNVIFEKSFGYLEGKNGNLTWVMEPDKLYLAVDEATNFLCKCEKGFQLWRLTSTPSAAGLNKAYRTLSSIFSKQYYQAEINLKSKNDNLKVGHLPLVKDLTFIESMLLNDGMTTDEITCNLVDIMLTGTNMMNSAMGFLLFNLSQNVKVQLKLLKELKEVLPTKDSLFTYNKLNSLRYLKACLKESLRLHFPFPVLYRKLQNDILLSNYIVPKETYVVMDYRVSGMKEQIFDDPERFVPERWLQDEKWMQNHHPFAAFPLCHGPRAELAKKVIEMQLLACTAKIIRNFQVEYHYGEIQGTDNLISLPDKPLKINFIDRDS